MRDIDIGIAIVIKAARFAADKTCNLRDLATAPPADWSAQRKADYFDWAGEVVAGLRGSHPKLDALFDEAWRLKGFV